MLKAAYTTILIAILLVLAVGCSASGASEISEKKLVVFAASSLTDVLQDLAAAFNPDHPEVTIVFNFAGSQQLRTQLEHGAQADIFISADWEQMDPIVEAGMVSGEATAFASNRLAIIATVRNTQVASLQDLARTRTKLVLAQPEVPVGRYSRTVINNLAADPQSGPDYADHVLSNVVSEETNVRNIAQKVALGEADAGIVYQTDALTPDITGRVRVIPVPDQSNVVASYPIALLKETASPDVAQQFIDFALSAQGQQVLVKHGFGPAELLGTHQNPPATTQTNSR